MIRIVAGIVVSSAIVLMLTLGVVSAGHNPGQCEGKGNAEASGYCPGMANGDRNYHHDPEFPED